MSGSVVPLPSPSPVQAALQALPPLTSSLQRLPISSIPPHFAKLRASMRGLNRFAASPARPITAAFSTHPYSTGRGRGRGANSPPAPSPPGHVPGQAESTAGEEEPFVSFGHGSGHPPLPSSAGLPSFSSLISSLKPSSSVGRGRGHTPSDTPQSRPKQPIFFRREDSESQPEKSQFADPSESAPLPSTFPPILSGSGRGKTTRTGESDTRAVEENRHLRIRSQPIGQRPPSSSPSQPKLGSEEAARRAVDILSRGGRSGPGGRGRGGRGLVGRGRGRGRGERFSGRRGRRDADHEFDLYLGDNADGEKLEKRLGEENMKILAEGFEEMSWRVLPSPTEEAYLDALHTNNMIEYEPEYIMEFDRNPDIEEKPPMPLEEVLATAKPFLMAYTGMKSQEEWEEAVNDLMERLPHIKELIDMYSGPDRVTAKQQQEELERVANTIPEKVPISVRRFADRAVLSLQSNPGWGFDKKCQFMDKLARDVSQHYK